MRAGLPRPTVCSRLTVLAALTDLEDDAVALECLHRARANAEHRVRCAKHTGLENLPFRGFVHTAVWLEISLIAARPIAWTQHLALDGDLAVCEPRPQAWGAASPPSVPPTSNSEIHVTHSVLERAVDTAATLLCVARLAAAVAAFSDWATRDVCLDSEARGKREGGWQLR